jgi:hypothetical protein
MGSLLAESRTHECGEHDGRNGYVVEISGVNILENAVTGLRLYRKWSPGTPYLREFGVTAHPKDCRLRGHLNRC